jgi:4-hydroxybenzoate polyprenyltransferase
MSASYNDTKARLKTLSAPEQEALLGRVLAHKQALTKAAQPWPTVAIMAWLAGILVFAASASREERSWLLLGLGLFFILSGWGFEMMAARKKREYERAHPFEETAA